MERRCYRRPSLMPQLVMTPLFTEKWFNQQADRIKSRDFIAVVAIQSQLNFSIDRLREAVVQCYEIAQRLGCRMTCGTLGVSTGGSGCFAGENVRCSIGAEKAVSVMD